MSATPNLSLNPGSASPEAPVAPCPETASPRLKAERVQLVAESLEARLKAHSLARLKAERVQERLRSLPGWRLGPDRRVIDRVREFADAESAAAYAGFLAGLASRSGQPIGLDVVGSRVVVTLWAVSPKGRLAGLTEKVLHFAGALG